MLGLIRRLEAHQLETGVHQGAGQRDRLRLADVLSDQPRQQACQEVHHAHGTPTILIPSLSAERIAGTNCSTMGWGFPLLQST